MAEDEALQTGLEFADTVAKSLVELLRNNPVSGSPRFDNNVIDVTLGLILLTCSGLKEQAEEWLTELINRIDYAFKIKRHFPISTDSYDDLAEATAHADDELRSRLMKSSWFIPTLAGWSVILNRKDLYNILITNARDNYPEVCPQLWHPTNDCAGYFYFTSASEYCGEAEAPIRFPDNAAEYRKMMEAISKTMRLDITTFSSACLNGRDPIDLVACRHFRTPVPPVFWYSFLGDEAG